MNASDFLKIANSVDQTLIKKYEKYYNDVLCPIFQKSAEAREVRREFSTSDSYCKKGIEIFGDNKNTARRVFEMKPYLESKGFHVGKSDPWYYTYVSWKN